MNKKPKSKNSLIEKIIAKHNYKSVFKLSLILRDVPTKERASRLKQVKEDFTTKFYLDDELIMETEIMVGLGHIGNCFTCYRE